MIRVIGIGPGNMKYLTFEAYEAIINSPCIVAFGRISMSLKSMNKDVINVKKIEEILKITKKEDNVTILASGDPCFFGVVEYLKHNNVYIDEVVPGISSFQYMMARLKKSWDKANFLSLHGRVENLETVKHKKLSVILTDEMHNPGFISETLYNMGVRGTIYAGFDLSYPEEKIIVRKIGEKVENISALSVVVIENEMDKG